jgi:hypothetical protein
MRFVLTIAFRPLFILTKRDLTFVDSAFVTMAGLRGSVSLIMSQAIVTETELSNPDYLVRSRREAAGQLQSCSCRGKPCRPQPHHPSQLGPPPPRPRSLNMPCTAT